VTIAPSSVAAVSAVETADGSNRFVVSLLQGNLPASDVAIGDTVTYSGLDAQGVAHSVQGTIAALALGQFTVRYDATLTQTPDPANHTFTIAHSGSLDHQLQAALGGLLDVQTADAEAPTLQDLIHRLSDLTGVDLDQFHVSITGADESLGVQLGIDL